MGKVLYKLLPRTPSNIIIYRGIAKSVLCRVVRKSGLFYYDVKIQK